MKSVDNTEQNYDSWDYILERISALKHSLKSKLASAKVTRSGNAFVIYLNDVFYKILSANTNDVELIRGLIAEKEKKGLEETGRKIRYQFFDEILENKKAKKRIKRQMKYAIISLTQYAEAVVANENSKFEDYAVRVWATNHYEPTRNKNLTDEQTPPYSYLVAYENLFTFTQNKGDVEKAKQRENDFKNKEFPGSG